jgi:transposase
MTSSPKANPSDISDEEWALVAPYLTLLREDAGKRAPWTCSGRVESSFS